MLCVPHICNVIEKCVSPGSLADVFNHTRNSFSHFLYIYGWHLITINHVIWLVCMYRWWRVFYFCTWFAKCIYFLDLFANSNTISRRSLALLLGRKRGERVKPCAVLHSSNNSLDLEQLWDCWWSSRSYRSKTLKREKGIDLFNI